MPNSMLVFVVLRNYKLERRKEKKQNLETAKILLMLSVIFIVDFSDNVTLLMA